MLMSSGGLVASSSGCATRSRAREVGSTGYTMPTQYSLLIGRYVMATAEHREPCDSRGSCTVLGAPEGEIPPGDSTVASVELSRHVGSTPNFGRITAAQRTDVLGQWATLSLALLQPKSWKATYVAPSIRRSISLRSVAKSMGLVRRASAPFSNALRFVSASP